MRAWIAAITVGLFCAQSCLTGQAWAATRPAAAPVVAEQAPAPSPNPVGDALTPEGQPAGGIVPCLLTCYIGPRTGLEYNEGRKVSQIEWIELIATLVPFVGFLIRMGIRLVTGALPAMGGKTMTEWVGENPGLDTRPIPPPPGPSATRGGASACFIACCLSPRNAYERNESRRTRSKEVFLFIPLINIVFIILIGLEAFNGKTMTQIAQEEGLDSPPAPAAAPQ